MREDGKIFNNYLFNNLIVQTFGPRSISKFARLSKISRQHLDLLTKGHAQNGPSAESWDKIKKTFKKNGVEIEVNDFFIAPEYLHDYADGSQISDAKHLYSKTAQKEIVALKSEIDQLKAQLKEKEQETRSLWKMIDRLEKENTTLSKEI